MSPRRLFTSILSCFGVISMLALTAPSAEAWGAKGHRLVGQVAKELLEPDARAAIKTIMGSDDLATFALFLDQQKTALDKQIPGSRQWHFDDVPACGTQPKNVICPQGRCASTQIVEHRKDLADVHSSPADKKFAIQVLTHLVGDIHQPLHAADNDDRGGNEINVSLTGVGGGTKKTNLHSVWDTDLVDRQFKSQTETAAAKGLIQKHGATAKTEDWMTKGTVDDWIAEAHKLAVDVTYGKLPGGFACGKDMEKKRIKLTNEYLQAGQDIVEIQIAKAGYRLAGMLNRIFGE
jgi:hypothetical protein